MLVCLLRLARPPVDLAEAELAVGDEGAHAAGLGEGQRLPVMRFAAPGIEPVGMRGDVAQQTQRISSPSEPWRKQFHRTSSQMLRLVELTEQQTREAQTVIGVLSETVKDIVAGSRLTFQDRGVHTLKGVDGPRRLFAVG